MLWSFSRFKKSFYIRKDDKEYYGFNSETLEPIWALDKDKKYKKIIYDLKIAINKADKVYIATDPDREGEAIAWHIKNYFKIKDQDYERVIFQALQKDQIIEALQNPQKIDEFLFNSYYTRRILDRVIGFDFTNFLRNKLLSKQNTGGRVQSVALLLVAKREKEIKNFIPQKYYVLKIILNIDNQDFILQFPKDNKKLYTNAEINHINKNLNEEFEVVDVKEKKVSAKKLFALSTAGLFQVGFQKLRMNPRQISMFAQELFEKGFISYHRTDSTRLEKVTQDQFIKHIKSLFEEKYWSSYEQRPSKKKNIQDAHEAIYPLNLKMTPLTIKDQKISGGAKKVYTLIYNISLACFITPPVTKNTKVTLKNNDFVTSISGSEQVFDGYNKILQNKVENIILPHYQKGDKIFIKKREILEKATTPPKRYNPASLVKKLEDEGVGRPSTYSTMIESIISEKKAYAILNENKAIETLDLGIEVSDVLEKNFEKIVDASYTSQLEETLDKISLNEVDYKLWFKNYFIEFKKLVDQAYEKTAKKELPKSEEKCPQCDINLVIRKNRWGKDFLSCPNYPKCSFAKNTKENEYVESDVECENCHIKLIIRKGRKGDFLGCRNFPKCRILKNLENGDSKEVTIKKTEVKEGNIDCDNCHIKLIIRQGKRGSFLGCRNFPKCRILKPLKGNTNKKDGQ